MESIRNPFPDLKPRQWEQFSQMQAHYEEWNEKINLISRKDLDRLYTRHILHSLTLSKFYPFGEGERIMDLGTGGGFPGIPLAIMHPEASFLLVDRIGKKIHAVRQIASALGLDNVEAVHGRGQDQHGPFDFVVSRAVAPLKDLWDWSQKQIRVGMGKGNLPHGLMALKGGDLREEIVASGQHSVAKVWPLETLIAHPEWEDKSLVYIPKTASEKKGNRT